MKRLSRLVLQMMTGLGVAVAMVLPASAAVPTNHLVISQVQTAGTGIGGLVDEFIELYNPTDHPISLAGWTIQYKTGNVAFDSTVVQPLPGSAVIAAYSYYLVRPVGLPQAADTNYAGFQLDELGGNVMLVHGTSQVTDANDAEIVDALGYGAGANGAEGVAAPAPAIGQSLERRSGNDLGEGNAIDTDNNSNDFIVRQAPKPRLTTSPLEKYTLPTISNFSPMTNTYWANKNVVVTATVNDGTGSGFLAGGIQLWVDDVKMGSASYDPATGAVSIPVTLSEGTHTLTLYATDKAGLTAIETALVTVDSIAPIASLEINDGGATTNSRWVLVKPIINEGPAGIASGIKEMRVAMDGVLDTEQWEPYQSAFNRELPDGEGMKTIQIQVRDRAGNQSNIATANVIFGKMASISTPAGVHSVTTLKPNGFHVHITWQADPNAVAYYVRYTDGSVLYGPYLTKDTQFSFDGLDTTKSYRFEIASVTGTGTVSDFVKVEPKKATAKTSAVVDFPTGGPVDQGPGSGSSSVASPSPEASASPSPTASPAVDGAEDNQPRDWTRIIVALSLLIIAAGLATGGWYLYQWWTNRPLDKGKGGRW